MRGKSRSAYRLLWDGHAAAHHAVNIVRVDDAVLDDDLLVSAIEQRDRQLDTAERLRKIDIGREDEVVLLATEVGVVLLLDNKDHVARLDARAHITLAVEGDFGSLGKIEREDKNEQS